MPSAGAVQPPRIVVLKDPLNFTPSHKIDTDTYIELACDTPYTKTYFTTDGTKPNPFQIGVAGRESTFKYKAPFTLNAGKRMIKAIAISRDGLQESAIVTKTFLVHEPEDPDDDSSIISSSASQVTVSSISANSSVSNIHAEQKKAHKNDKNKEKQLSASAAKAAGESKGTVALLSSHPSTPRSRQAWSAGAHAGHDAEVAAERPFNPTNYSGTQINLWGLPSDSWQPLVDSARGVAGLLPPSANARPFTPQPDIGFMTNQMMRKLEEQRMMTVADVRRAVQESMPAQHPHPPPPVEQPVIKSEPEMKLCSPGNGNWREQVDHIYAHLIDYARSNPDFRTALGEPKMGKIVDADFVDGDHDTVVLTVAISRYGIPKTPNLRTVAKVARAFNKPATTTAKPATAAAGKPAAAAAAAVVSKAVTPPTSKPASVKGSGVAAAPAKPVPSLPSATVEEATKDPDSYFVTEEYQQEGTLKPFPGFNAEADCQALQKAMKGIGTDEDAITAVLGHRSATQRTTIVKTYKTMFGKDLVAELKSEIAITGNYLKVLEGLCLSPAEFDAFHLRAAMKGVGTDEQGLIEVVCTRTNDQLKAVKDAFKRLYGKELEAAIVSDTSGLFKNLLVALLQANRDESPTYDAAKAKEDAQRLLEAGELKKWGTDSSTFNSVMVTRSYPHLRAMFDEYQSVAGKSLEDSITSETSGDFRNGLLALVQCIRNKQAYFANVLYKSMKGLGTDDLSLQRVLISRCEIDMVQIKEHFEAAYKQTLAAFIIDDTSGHFRKILIALIGEERAMAKK